MWRKPAIGRYGSIGLAGIVLLAVSWILPVRPAFAQQQMQRQLGPLMGPAGAPMRLETPITPPPDSPDALSQKQKSAIVSSNFTRAKQDAAKLRQLADALEKEVDATNQNVLSLRIVESASKIEKLARKIRNEAKDN
ncbi:MAG: hypothetical protein ACRD1O_11675 [Terriglobia bacterium]